MWISTCWTRPSCPQSIARQARFSYKELSRFISVLTASGRIAGADFAIYDPERDPGLKYAGPLVACIAAGVRPRAAKAGAA
jgi:hypothetical protein